MSEAYDRAIAAAGGDLTGSLRAARERVEATWDAHESGGPEPQVEALLRGLPDRLRGPISSVLEGIDRGRPSAGAEGVGSHPEFRLSHPDLHSGLTRPRATGRPTLSCSIVHRAIPLRMPKSVSLPVNSTAWAIHLLGGVAVFGYPAGRGGASR